MAATKPLIKCESEFLAFADDFVAMNVDAEQGFLEEIMEDFVTKSGWGSNVRAGASLDFRRNALDEFSCLRFQVLQTRVCLSPITNRPSIFVGWPENMNFSYLIG